MIPVIICGGVGSKMWPESSREHPKHFLPLIGDESLFQINWEDLRKRFKPEEIWISTTREQIEMARGQVGEIVPENCVVEPEGRNTGPAIGLIAAILVRSGKGDEPFVIVQADDLRRPVEGWLEMIDLLENLAKETDKYITGCLRPERVVRGLDYLVKGKEKYGVADYIDRTEEEKLEKYLGTDSLMMHCNHTTMTPNNYLKMYQRYRRDWYEPLKEIAGGGEVERNFLKMAKGPQEEVTKLAHRDHWSLAVELPFEWVDFGTWESLARYLANKKQEQGTHHGGQAKNKLVEVEGENNFVRSKKPVAIIGLSGLVVIDGENGLLVCPKSESGKVGEAVERLVGD